MGGFGHFDFIHGLLGVVLQNTSNTPGNYTSILNYNAWGAVNSGIYLKNIDQSYAGAIDLVTRATSGTYGVAMRIDQNGNVGIGTTSPQYKLAVNGTIGAKDVIVTNTGWSDYVLRPGYRLRPLSEVSQYIEANGHLPDIPTEAEVKEKGVSLGDMQSKLLAKVEELTLHMIQADKDNRELREDMNRQQEENRELRDRLVRLEKAAAADPKPAPAK